MTSVMQDWVNDLTMMQQSVLLTGIRGPDNIPKYHPVKYLVRWYRRSVIKSSFKGVAILNPWEADGGSFYGTSIPVGVHDRWEDVLDELVADQYIKATDEIPHHFHMHMMHCAEIVGYKHPDERVRKWWASFYTRLANDMHLHPELEVEMDSRLGGREGWLARADKATLA